MLKDDERKKWWRNIEILSAIDEMNGKIWKTNIGFVYLFTILFYLYVIRFLLSFEILLLTGKKQTKSWK